MRKWIVAAMLAVVAAGVPGAGAQTWPSRPITLIAPFPAGGPLDSIARVIAEPMREALGQPVVIENMAGAGGNLGVGRVARSDPDGYTVVIGQWSTHVVNPVTYSLNYDVQEMEPIGLLTITPQLIIARKDFPAKDIKDLIAWLKANPDKATAGTVGAAGGAQVASIYFQKETGTTFRFVPYRGGGPAIQDMAAGQLDVMLDQAANALGPVRAGTVKAYAVMSKTRWQALPDVPSADEVGNARALRCLLACDVGAQGHAEGRRRKAERRDKPCARRSECEQAALRYRPRSVSGGSEDTAGARRLSQGGD